MDNVTPDLLTEWHRLLTTARVSLIFGDTADALKIVKEVLTQIELTLEEGNTDNV